MPQKRLSMRKIKEILRLSWGMGLGRRQVARSLCISHSTVIECIDRALKAGLSWPLPGDLDEGTLEGLLYPPCAQDKPPGRALPDFEYIHRELRRKGVTLQLLWEEYREVWPEGYRYSRFCELYRRWKGKLDVTLRQEHRAGEKVFVDYAGQTVPVVDGSTGEVREASIFVAVLGASNYTYAEASQGQDLASWISSHVRAFEYFGGVPEIIVPDNLRTGISRSCRYEPDLNPTYNDMAVHYGTCVIPARVRAPRDKAKVEAGVQLVECWILARLRNRTFFSMEELNEVISDLLESLNTRKFKKLDTTRRALFLSMEKPALKSLPRSRYEYAQWKKARVNIDYHIEVEGHYYSVPYQLVHKAVEVRYTSTTLEVIYKGRRVATHRRSYRRGAFTSLNEHRPRSHQKYLEWTPSRIIRWARDTGPHTAKVVETILRTRPHPEQGYRSCLGILRLGRRYTGERLEAACARAAKLRAFSYKSVKSILATGLDREPVKDDSETKDRPSVHHDNVRGAEYYN